MKFIMNNLQSNHVLNEKFCDALRSLKEAKHIIETDENKLIIFGIKQSLKRYLTDLIWMSVVMCNYTLEATFDDSDSIRTLDIKNYWLVIANFEKTKSIIVL